MDLERVALALRARTAWEAMDLGIAMARTWWRPVWGAWFAVYLPVAVALHLALIDHLVIASLVMWWLKPAFDRVVLHVLGTAVFDSPPRVRDTLRALKRALTPGLLANLTLYRFDLARSFNLPVWQLERARGAEGRRRARVLHRKARGHAVWLTVICIHFEIIMLLSLLMLINMLTPGAYDGEAGFTALFSGAGKASFAQELLNNLLYLAAVSVVEPFYVAGGFALYMNRRTQLEAWDIELALRRLSERVPRRVVSAAAAVCVLSLVALCWIAPPALAADTPAKSARAELTAVLADKAFDRYKEEKEWRYTGRGLGLDESKDEKKNDPGLRRAIWELFWRCSRAHCCGRWAHWRSLGWCGSPRATRGCGRGRAPPATGRPTRCSASTYARLRCRLTWPLRRSHCAPSSACAKR